MNAVSSFSLPGLPYPEFPLRPHRNGQWYKSVWNSHSRKSEQHYFGSWKDDPEGERALSDPVCGWLARRNAIKSGADNIRVERIASEMTLAELMGRFLAHKLSRARSGELSLVTLGDYFREIKAFVEYMKSSTPPEALRPEHFTAYMYHLTERRKLGRHSRKRVRAYVTAFLNFGATNGWYAMPGTGADWIAPATDPDSIRQAKARAGVKDFSGRILTGEEIGKLLNRSTPNFRAMILLGINCGLGPADIGRLRWNMIDLERRRLQFPRPKTGAMRVGYLWKCTREALNHVRALKHSQQELERNGNSALVFVTRNGLPFYRETELQADVEIDGKKIRKVIGVKVHKPILCTFGRMVRELNLEGVSFYRLRHTFKTLGKKARDREILDLMMGHKDPSTGKIYDHEDIDWRHVRRVARIVYRQLWPKITPSVNRLPVTVMADVVGAESEAA
jgi:integrase